MKHGYVVMGRDELLGEVSYGSYLALRDAKMSFKFLKVSPNLSEFQKKHLRVVELVERVIDMKTVV